MFNNVLEKNYQLKILKGKNSTRYLPYIGTYIFQFTYRYSSNFEVFALLFKYRYGTYPDPDLDPNVEYGTDPEGH